MVGTSTAVAVETVRLDWEKVQNRNAEVKFKSRTAEKLTQQSTISALNAAEDITLRSLTPVVNCRFLNAWQDLRLTGKCTVHFATAEILEKTIPSVMQVPNYQKTAYVEMSKARDAFYVIQGIIQKLIQEIA